MDKEQKELWEDLKDFLIWVMIGAMSGWILCILAYRGTIIYSKLDLYGMFGVTIAVFWAIFRRLKHVEHLPHIHRHLVKK